MTFENHLYESLNIMEGGDFVRCRGAQLKVNE
uniref:Uncharacterized protein n=1 Tax=Anguilla anguilla TaxID=7936 RepID=A0A0E9PG02_ANGAN